MISQFVSFSDLFLHERSLLFNFKVLNIELTKQKERERVNKRRNIEIRHHQTNYKHYYIDALEAM